jgi:hypothetical protein
MIAASKTIWFETGHKSVPAMARLYGGNIVIVWKGGLATKQGTREEFEALPEKFHEQDLNEYTVKGSRP